MDANLYRLVAAQLQDDGFIVAAQAVASTAFIPLSEPGTVPKHALQRQLNGEGGLGVLDLLDSGIVLGRSREYNGYQARWSSMLTGPSAARFSGDGKLLAVGSADSSVRLLDVWSILHGRIPEGAASTSVLQTYTLDHAGHITDVEFHPRGGILVSASQDCTMCFYDVARGSARANRKCTDTHPVNSIAYHPGGELLLAATTHPALHLYDVATFRCFLSPVEAEHHSGPIAKAAWAPDGSRFASCSADAVKIWDGASCRCARTMARAHSGAAVSCVVFSSSGSHLLTCGADSCVRLWDVGSGRLVRTFEGALLQTARASCWFSHDEVHVLCADEASASIIVWSVQTGEIVQRCAGHTRPITALAHSPGLAAFVTTSDDGQVRIWTGDL